MEKSRICLTLTESSIEANANQVWRYRDYIDMAELRADYLDRYQIAYIYRFPELVDLPVILTFRRKCDGGKFDGNASERFSLIKEALAGKFAFVDLESDAHNPELEKLSKAKGIRIIRSIHDFKGVPDNLPALFAAVSSIPGELPKIAVMPHCIKDVARFLQFAQNPKEKEKILICMNDYGFATRILAAKLGSYLTFCSAPGTRAAPGHIDPVMLNDVYRVRTITAATKVFGIIGNPIMHTASPAIHNRGYSLLGIDAVYVPFLVDKVEDFIPLVDLLDIRGCSVTIPHKAAIIPFLTEKEPELDSIGACNTVEKLPGGLRGSNTDVYGFITPLKKIRKKLAGLKATVIGAGGVANAAVYALTREKVRVLILNRTVERAEKLARIFQARYAGLDKEGIGLMDEYADIIVQTTSVGMEPDLTGDPVSAYNFKGREIVYELIYKPEKTRFLQRAEEAGCTIIGGMEMLLLQAYAQFYKFTGKEYPPVEEE